ncbi:MAG: HAD-IA family hydrolase [Paracoccaceae bacterium]
MSDLKLVVFDVDGTLIDSQDVIFEAMSRTFRRMNRPVPSKAKTLSVVGLSLEEAVAKIAPDLTDTEVIAGADMYRRSFIEMRGETGGEAHAPLYPGALSALERLHSIDEILLGVATGKARRGLDHAYETHDIGHFFATSQTADGHPSKPHPAMLESALFETGCDAARAVMIGDTEFDIEMGKAAGFTTIAVSWGYHPLERLAGSSPDFIIDDFYALHAVLDEIWAGSA